MLDKKRKIERFDILLNVKIKPNNESTEYLWGITGNFSHEGLSFESKSFNLEPKEPLDLTIQHPIKNTFISSFSDIVWKKDLNGICLTGVKFREIDEEAKNEILDFAYNIKKQMGGHEGELSLDKIKANVKAVINMCFLPQIIFKRAWLYLHSVMVIAIILVGLSANANLNKSSQLSVKASTKEALQLPSFRNETITKESEESEQKIFPLIGKEVEAKTFDSPEKDQLKTQNKEAFKDIEKLEKEISRLEEKDKTQEMKKPDEKIINKESTLQIIYTIQAGSFLKIERAQKQFNSIIQYLNEKDLNYLRIEKIGKYYTLRLGKFDDHASADKLLKSIRSHLPSALVMKAYFKKERIVKKYKYPQQTVTEILIDQKSFEEPETKVHPQKMQPGASKKTDIIKKEEPLAKQLTIVTDLFNKKDFNSALAIIKIEIENQPENPEINSWYGTILLKLNQPAEALSYLQKAVDLSPETPNFHNSLGYCLFFLNRYENAIDEFNKAVTIEPEHIDALTGLGIIYAKRGEKEKAIDIYHKLKELDKYTAEKLLLPWFIYFNQ
jgi:tetratricopeptide (TPR) repeat protein